MRLFDTDFLIDLIDGSEKAIAFAKKVEEEKPYYISVISVHEYLFGVHYRFYNDRDLLSKKLLLAEKSINAFEVLPLTRELTAKSAEIHAALIREGKGIGINDVFIGTTALYYGFVLVTNNRRHFEVIDGLEIEEY